MGCHAEFDILQIRVSHRVRIPHRIRIPYRVGLPVVQGLISYRVRILHRVRTSHRVRIPYRVGQSCSVEMSYSVGQNVTQGRESLQTASLTFLKSRDHGLPQASIFHSSWKREYHREPGLQPAWPSVLQRTFHKEKQWEESAEGEGETTQASGPTASHSSEVGRYLARFATRKTRV